MSGEGSKGQVPNLDLDARVRVLEDEMRTSADAIERIRRDVERLLAAQMASSPEAPSKVDSRSVAVHDRYYWAFEASMRGSSASVRDRLSQYSRLAVSLREALSIAEPDDDLDHQPPNDQLAYSSHAEEPDPPLWIDLGCGQGEFCDLVRGWGWRVGGVDDSPAAIAACRKRGIEATLADVTSYLADRGGESVGAISGIQLIEHLPRQEWLLFFQRAHSALRTGGALLLETINPLNVDAMAAFFVADITHTWPGHPSTLALMAEHVGFEGIDVTFMNPDQRGNAQDVALWAVKP